MFELLWAILILSIYSLKHEGIIIDFILFLQHFKIFKLGKIDMIQVLGSLEDEQMFSKLEIHQIQDPQLIDKSLGFICLHV